MKHIKTTGAALLAALTITTACTSDFLEPDPLSFYEPATTYATESGLQATLAMADKHMRQYWTNYGSNNTTVPIALELQYSDLANYGKTDISNNGCCDNYADKLTPTSLPSGDDGKMTYFWDETWTGIKHANTILGYVDGVKGLSEAKKNEYKGRAYFHRAYRYLMLTCQFGDVPLVTKLPSVPKENYQTCSKDAILEMCVGDMEKAVEWVPEQKDMTYVGMVNKGACRMLLAKLYLATGRFAEAEKQCDELIAQHPLVVSTFGTFAGSGEPETWAVTRNVIWDLHRPQNKYIAANTESIMVMPNSSDETHTDFLTMRIFGPFWSDANLKMPDGQQACVNYARTHKDYNKQLDALRAFGRGIATVRINSFYQHPLWKVNNVEDTLDLRHNAESGNWVRMEDIKCNNPKSSYYGQPLRFAKDDGTVLMKDTIRDWFDFPLYKFYLKDENAEKNLGASQFNGATKGSDATWYLYRSAEAYLLRAEAKYYQGKDATSDVNAVRQRAHCSELYTSVNIGDIVNERARELLLEEWRHAELVRISRCLALSGKPDEWGNTYSKDNFDKQDGTDRQGGSYWYQRLIHYSLYNRDLPQGIITGTKNFIFKMDKHNIYWPIPNGAITSNKKAQLRQNYGYTGYDDAVPMWKTWQEAVEDEDKN